MDEMDAITAPQWLDFIDNSSPQVPMPDYFEKEHEIHGHIIEFCDSTSENAEKIPTDMICTNQETGTENLDVIQDVSVKVISPKYRNKTKVEEFTSDQVLNDAMKKLQLCAKQIKTQDAINKSTQESVIFKTPSRSVARSSRSITTCHSTGSLALKKFAQSNTTPRYTKVNICTLQNSNNTNTSDEQKVSVKCSLFKPDEPYARGDILKKQDDTKDKEVSEECNEEENKLATHDKLKESTDDENKDSREERDNVIDVETKQCDQAQPRKQRTKVITWQNGKRSLNQRRLSCRFISLAEAVSRFQNDTPKRFRTKCNKNPVGISNNPILKPIAHLRLAPTIPVSPALVSKNRKRTVTVLSKEEREKQELMELRKHRIKANPIPPNVLQGPSCPVSKKIAAKKITTQKSVSSFTSTAAQLSKKTDLVRTEKFNCKNFGASRQDKTFSSSVKNIVTKVLITDPKGVIIDQEEITHFGVPKSIGSAKSTTRIVPFSFEARNKDLQMKKEQRLKDQGVDDKTKTEFHAKPAPNFSKTMLSLNTKLQAEKKTVQPCPFSFEERDKNLAKKKEKLVKQILEEDKQSRLFRAKPVPVFKPVMVRGVSTDRLSTKEKVANMESIEFAVDKWIDQENKEPNIVATGKKRESEYTRKAKSVACIVEKKNSSLKDKERQAGVIKMTLPLELNTDKRAKERREFHEKLKRKELEEEAKRQELNKERLEQEKQLRIKLRKMAEVKARPMPTYKPLMNTVKSKPLVEPQSPMLGDKHKFK